MRPTGLALLPHEAPMGPHVLNIVPPFRARPGSELFLGGILIPVANPSPARDLDDDSRSGLKERNRLAAKKWRLKKDQMLGELEARNDDLRKQALDLVSELQALRVQSRLLEEELGFFQGFMSKMMAATK
jgi:hypothetical protein